MKCANPQHPAIDVSAAGPDDDLNRAKAAVRAARSAKRLIARRFKTAKNDPAAFEALKAEMQVATTTFKAAEAELRLLLQKSDSLHTDEPGSKDTLIPSWMTLRPTAASAPDTLEFEALDDANASDWDAYIADHPRATLYHDSRWRQIICNTMGQRSLSLLARSEGRVVGVLPLYRLTSRLFGDFAVSVPYVNYGGPLGDLTGTETALLEYAVSNARNLGLDHLEFRELHFRDGWSSRTDKVSMIRRLPATPEILSVELGSKVRAQISRGVREGLECTFGGLELVDEFYKVFARNMRDLGTPVYSKRLFHDLLDTFDDMAELVIVRKKSRPIGGAFLLRHHGVLEIPWASTLRETNRIGTNMFMYWQIMCRAIEQGCEFFDFGRSTKDDGSYHFKQQWGARPVQHFWHYALLSDANLPVLNPGNPKYRLLIAIWQRLPVALTRLIGPPVVRRLP